MINEVITIKMFHPGERSTGEYNVIKISDFEYKLTENNPFSEDLSYGTIIEVENKLNKDGIFQFKKIAKESDFRLEIYGLNLGLNEAELRLLGDKIVKNGGHWEVIFGGMAYVNLPKDSNLDIGLEIKKIKNEINNSR